ncbi:MAG TPA: hypothetical protein VFZ59_04835 [Verrucomicrobiae bacterium]|nr:hypothetical protein [Verrucomicrobiae bacterium]
MGLLKFKLTIGILVGFLAGAIVGFMANRNTAAQGKSEDFSIQVLNQVTAIKINKRTGETWQFDFREDKEANWKPIQTRSDGAAATDAAAGVIRFQIETRNAVALAVVAGFVLVALAIFLVTRSKQKPMASTQTTEEGKSANGSPATLTSPPETLSDQTFVPGESEDELQKRIKDFVATEFPLSGEPFRRRADKFIFDRVRLAARHHFSAHRTMKGFRDAEQMRIAAAKFTELTH